MNSAKYCTECGAKARDQDKFCSCCGTKFSITNEVKTKTLDAESYVEEATAHEINLVCPKCLHQSVANFEVPQTRYSVTCNNCKKSFQTQICHIRAKKTRGNKKSESRSYSIRAKTINGIDQLIEFDDASYEDFELRSGDLAVFSYYNNEIRIVQNVDVAQYKTISKPWCYIATCVYGENSEQVKTLRGFRDNYLLHSRLHKIVPLYYRVSPYLIRHLGKSRIFHLTSRFLITSLIKVWTKKLRRVTDEST